MLQVAVPEVRLEEPVKLVIWDLDDTFWSGTLSEEAVTPIPENIALVKTLATRGIISSIASKNDAGAVEAALRKLDVWDWFVLPSVSFQSKGVRIAGLIDALQLRPANVVFIDDNPSVLAEAAFACPGLVCLDSPAQLAAQMDADALRGAEDPHLKRLLQYRQLAARHDVRQCHTASEEDFLRQSAIRVEIDYAVEPHIDRVIELINRSNQLNFTKKRVETGEARVHLKKTLTDYGFKAGIVRVSDKYADYGIVGFFLTLATLRGYTLEHFVFSCRIMNMGVEQYVFDFLNRPSIKVVEPVANPIVNYPLVDWIAEGAAQEAVAPLKDTRLVLIGGCDMLQLSTYCSMNSAEFTNRHEMGVMKRLDDPYFILEDDPERITKSKVRKRVPAYNAADVAALQEALPQADVVLVSLFRMLEVNYFRCPEGMVFRLDEDALKTILQSPHALWFIRNFTFVELSQQERNDLVRRAIWRLAEKTRPECKIIVLLENLREQNNRGAVIHKGNYNDLVRSICSASDKLNILDINQVTDSKWMWDDGFHMAREGYFELAQAVTAMVTGCSGAEGA